MEQALLLRSIILRLLMEVIVPIDKLQIALDSVSHPNHKNSSNKTFNLTSTINQETPLVVIVQLGYQVAVTKLDRSL